jgi:hypothetical protein
MTTSEFRRHLRHRGDERLEPSPQDATWHPRPAKRAAVLLDWQIGGCVAAHPKFDDGFS